MLAFDRGCVETKNFISISANESIDFLHFLVSKFFPAKNDLNPPNRAFKAFFSLISPRKKGLIRPTDASPPWFSQTQQCQALS